MADELRERLAEATRRRIASDQQQKADHNHENQLIAEAWRAKMPPSEIAAITGRSPAHIRNLRPGDVPPLRLGGTPKKTALKRRKK